MMNKRFVVERISNFLSRQASKKARLEFDKAQALSIDQSPKASEECERHIKLALQIVSKDNDRRKRWLGLE